MAIVKYSLQEFIHDMDELLKEGPDNEKMFDRGSSYLERLIRNPGTVPENYRFPLGTGTRPGHGTYKLHEGENGLSISSVVWGPGDHIDPHDHHTWGMIGVMENVLSETRFRRLDDCSRNDYAILEKDRVVLSKTGEVSLLVPDTDEIHQIDNETDRPTVEIHVYGRSLVGLDRCRFELATGKVFPFSSGKADNE